MKLRLSCVAAVLSLILLVAPVYSHHSISAEFNPTRTIALTGLVTKVEWMNPHSYFYIDVKDGNGHVVRWALEGNSPKALVKIGWKRDTVKTGDVITVKGYPARDGSTLISGLDITFPDGHRVPLIGQ